MASIGELTATVRADISGYVGPMTQVVATNQRVATSVTSATAPIAQVGEKLTATAAAGANWAGVMERVEHQATVLGLEASGLGLHFGRLAASLGPLVGEAGVFAVLAVGMAAAVKLFEHFNAAADHQKEVVDNLAKAWHDFTGETARANLALANNAVLQATHQRLTFRREGPMGIPIPVLEVQQTKDLKEALDAAHAAGKAYDDWVKEHSIPWHHTLADTLRDEARAVVMVAANMHSLMGSGLTNPLMGFTNADRGAALDVLARSREMAAARAEVVRHIEESVHLDASDVAILVHNNEVLLERLGLLENQAEKEKRIAKIKGDSSVKDAVKVDDSNMRSIAEGAAHGFASAFGSALRGQTKGLLDSIAAVLKDAILGAIDKLISEKVFEALMRAFTPSKGIGGGIVGEVTGIVTSLFGAPSVPMAGAMAGGATVVVSGRNIPPALSPVQHARDQQWQALLIESNRVAEANGARWRYAGM